MTGNMDKEENSHFLYHQLTCKAHANSSRTVHSGLQKTPLWTWELGKYKVEDA
jgi:hypothetical protein